MCDVCVRNAEHLTGADEQTWVRERKSFQSQENELEKFRWPSVFPLFARVRYDFQYANSCSFFSPAASNHPHVKLLVKHFYTIFHFFLFYCRLPTGNWATELWIIVLNHSQSQTRSCCLFPHIKCKYNLRFCCRQNRFIGWRFVGTFASPFIQYFSDCKEKSVKRGVCDEAKQHTFHLSLSKSFA